jgi:hypothetical protein
LARALSAAGQHQKAMDVMDVADDTVKRFHGDDERLAETLRTYRQQFITAAKADLVQNC